MFSTYPHPPLLPSELEATRTDAEYFIRDGDHDNGALVCPTNPSHDTLSRRLVVNRNLDIGFDGLAVAEGRNEFRAIEIRKRRAAETEQRRYLR